MASRCDGSGTSRAGKKALSRKAGEGWVGVVQREPDGGSSVETEFV